MILLGIIYFTFLPGCRKHHKNVNVVLIVIDTLRHDHLPFYGYKKNTAPFLSEIAAKSVVFEKAFAASSWTAPSTASIFTSLYPFQHGVVMGFLPRPKKKEVTINRIPEKIKTIPEVLKENGYYTYGVANNINICEQEGFTQGFDIFNKFDYYRGNKKEVNDQLKKWAPKIKTNGKYFLYIHYNDPHKPYHKRKPWYQKGKKMKANIISRYDSEISYVDDMIREMFVLFEWHKNTVLIITSDHGEEFWDHGQINHGRTLYSEVIQIPFFIYFPERDRQPKRIRNNVSNIDILPTLRGYLHLDGSQNDEGLNLMPIVFSSKSEKNPRYIFSHLHIKLTSKDILIKSVIHKNWKCIFNHRDLKELYDLTVDPDETNNLYNKDLNIFNLLKYKFIEFESNCTKFKQETVELSLDKKELKELKTLGYIR